MERLSTAPPQHRGDPEGAHDAAAPSDPRDFRQGNLPTVVGRPAQDRQSRASRLGQLLQTCLGRQTRLYGRRSLHVADDPPMAAEETPENPDADALPALWLAQATRPDGALEGRSNRALPARHRPRASIPAWLA